MRQLAFLLAAAVCATGLAACSGDGSSPTDPVADQLPAAVADLRIIAGEDGALTLAWTSPVSPGGKSVTYELRRTTWDQVGAPFSSWTALVAPGGDDTAGNEREHRVAGLTAGETYAFGLRASAKPDVWSATSNYAVGAAAPDHDRIRPGPVTRLSMWAATDTSLTVAWVPAGDDSVFGTGVTEHDVRWSPVPLTVSNWDAASRATGPITASSRPGFFKVAIPDLEPDAFYYVAVRGIDEIGHLGALGPNIRPQVRSMRTIYVNVEGTGDAPTIHEAVNQATWRDRVIVGPGRYTWTNQGTGSHKQGLIQVHRGRIGFLVRSEAGPEETIIDAEGQGPVMRLTGEPNENGIIVEGFTFTGGNSTGQPNSPTEEYAGGGLILHHSSSTFRNCIITGNEAIDGGGVWCGGVGEILFEDCIVTGNEAHTGGGFTLINSSLRMTLRNTEIRDNRAFYGGGIWSYHVLFTLEDVLIADNHATRQGGGLWSLNVHPGCELTRTTIADNFCSLGSAIYVVRSTATEDPPPDEVVLRLDGVLVTGNEGSAAFGYSMRAGFRIGCTVVWGNPSGDNRPTLYRDMGGNFAADPLLCDQDDYTLAAGSPCLPGNHPAGTDCGRIGARGQGCAE
ncbi:MAG: hypothetical protein GY838_05535 [bacterium]|nr:hypothetical protein [bacterium]